jgi:hypothetical protein
MLHGGEVECRCGNVCCIEGEFPKLFAWCDVCEDYANLTDDPNADFLADSIDQAKERSKYADAE